MDIEDIVLMKDLLQESSEFVMLCLELVEKREEKKFKRSVRKMKQKFHYA